MHARVEANPLALWYGILVGPISWAMCEGLNYSLEQHACSTGHYYVLTVIDVVTFLFALSGAWLAWTEYQKLSPGEEHGGNPHDRSWFMAVLGFAASLGFAMVIVAETIPHFILPPCA